jgi:ATP-binding cassette subfamily C protein CydD
MRPIDLRLLLLGSGSRSLLSVFALGSIIWSAIIVAHALLLTSVIIGVIEKSAQVLHGVVLLGALWIFRLLFQSLFDFWCSAQAVKIKEKLRREVTSELTEFENVSPSYLTGLLVKGFNSLDTYIGRFLPQMFNSITVPVAVIATMVWLDPLSGLIAVLTIPLIPFFGAFIGKFTSDSVAKKWRTLGTLSKYFEDSLRGFLTLRIFGRQRSQPERIQEMGDQYTQETMKVLRISFLSALVLELCATMSVALIAVVIGLRLVDGEIIFYNALAVLILAPEVYFPLRNAATLFHASADGSQAFEEINALKERKQPHVEESDFDFSDFISLGWTDWTLDIPGVTQSHVPATLIHPGEVIIILGESGIGKTSFAENLLAHTFDAELTFNGFHEVTASDKKSWQRSVGWIPQTVHMARGSIADQFKILDSQISDQEIVDRLAQLSLQVQDLPAGLETQVGGSGEKSDALSGGQLRKLATARALLRNPKIIVADEPTADLDHKSAQAVMRILREAVSQGAALICITHDVAMINPGDRVVEVSRTLN